MAFETDGILTTDVQEIADAYEWDTQAEWNAFQSKTDITIENGILKLTEVSAFPDPLVTLYEYEDDSNTTTAIDSIGSNNANITNATYVMNPAVGSLALDHGDDNDQTVSQNAVDLATSGDTNGLAIMAWVSYDSFGSGTQYVAGWGVDNNNFVMIIEREGVIGSFYQVGGNNSILSTSLSTANQYYWIYVEIASDGTHTLYVDNTQEAADSSGLDPTNIGAGNYRTGGRIADGVNPKSFDIDDFGLANSPLSTSERQTMYDRGSP